MKLELCIETIEEAKVANEFKFDRIELCSALDLGGLTPSIGLIETCAKLKHVETHVMIRPRGGNFVYSQNELDIMILDIRNSAHAGAKGVVFGILNNDNMPDQVKLEKLISLARSLYLETTFHRAFDLTRDPMGSLDRIIELGFDRLLTSGQKEKAFEGRELIKKLTEFSEGRIQIMAGSSVNETNIKALLKTGINALHFTARKKTEDIPLKMGSGYEPDPEKIERILKCIN